MNSYKVYKQKKLTESNLEGAQSLNSIAQALASTGNPIAINRAITELKKIMQDSQPTSYPPGVLDVEF